MPKRLMLLGLILPLASCDTWSRFDSADSVFAEHDAAAAAENSSVEKFVGSAPERRFKFQFAIPEERENEEIEAIMPDELK